MRDMKYFTVLRYVISKGLPHTQKTKGYLEMFPLIFIISMQRLPDETINYLTLTFGNFLFFVNGFYIHKRILIHFAIS